LAFALQLLGHDDLKSSMLKFRTTVKGLLSLRMPDFLHNNSYNGIPDRPEEQLQAESCGQILIPPSNLVRIKDPQLPRLYQSPSLSGYASLKGKPQLGIFPSKGNKIYGRAHIRPV